MKSVINLIRTPLGFSLIEGDVEINKSSNKIVKEKAYSLPKKYAQQNFTIYPYISSKDVDNHKYILIPARTQWFNMNVVHEIEKKALPEWFKIKKGILATMSNIKFEKHEELYKKYRNYIIELGKGEHISPSRARKGLAGDACAIIRIHKFLEKWGLINYIHKKPSTKQPGSPPNNELETQPNIQLSKRKDCFDRDKLITSRSYGKDDLQLLKKITRKFRPICHFCEGITGVIWYEYVETFHLKEFVSDEGRESKLIRNNEKPIDYKLTICASCIYEGNIPVVLTSTDFKKRSILEELEEDTANHESEKKKNNEQNRVADAIEKNKFKIKKTADQLKMSTEHVFRVLMTMPIQKLEKISRIEPETDAEKEDGAANKINTVVNGVEEKKETKESEYQDLEDKIRREVSQLEGEEREVYEKFLQSWLLKINLKMQRLGEWESGVRSKYSSTLRLERNILADRVQSLAKNL